MEFSAEGGAHALRRQQLSALMDGDLAPPAVAPLVAAWRDEADLQASWQLYSLVGDVLRSEELARSPQADTQFLSALRTRLQAEPVPLAPAPLATAAGAGPAMAGTEPMLASVAAPAAALPLRRWSRRRWAAPVAMAAGVAAVAGVVVVTRGLAPGSGEGLAGGQMALAPAAVIQAQAPLAPRPGVAEGAVRVVNGTVLDGRDPGAMARYFSAHRRPVPSGAVMQVQLVDERP